jgi:hypothetical protein
MSSNPKTLMPEMAELLQISSLTDFYTWAIGKVC